MYGQVLKRMSFLFKKNGKDFYTFRSDYSKNGNTQIRLFGVDGKYDFEYWPQERIAVRRPTKGNWNETNYAKAKDWHFNLDGYEVVDEKVVNGKDCYVMEGAEDIVTVWKQNGMKTSLLSKRGNDGQPLIWDNFAFGLSEDEFSIPEGTDIKDE